MTLHNISHNLPIDLRKLCEILVSKLGSLPLAGNCGNTSAHALFDGSLFLYADETKRMWPILCEFLW